MQRRFQLFLTILVLACGGLPAAALRAEEESPRLSVQLERGKIYEDESVIYQVLVENVKNAREPKLAGFDDFSIDTLESRALDSQRVSFDADGPHSEIIHRGWLYTYRLTPKSLAFSPCPAPRSISAGGSFAEKRSN